MRLIFYFVFLALFLISCTNEKQKGKEEPRQINGMKFSSLKLKNNLEVMLVSDERFKNSAAALAVGVGSLADPGEFQGMAHYLEHMLFMGTKKYPKHDEYNEFIKKNGGYSNAYTADDLTNYQFEVDTSVYEQALDRFAQFFIAPLLDARFLEKEKNAVNSEFNRNIEKDSWRLYRMSAVIAKKDHPFNTFNIGSLETLKNVSQKEVLSFYKKYYSSDNMKLVLVSSKPLGELKQLATKHFQEIPQFKYKKETYDDQFFTENNETPLTFIKSINDHHKLNVFFNTPESTPYWDSKPTLILSYLFGDESEGSLLSYLKAKGWALELSASAETFWRDFGLNITLTKKGRKEYKKVIQAIFAYIHLVKEKGYPKYIFEDNKEIARLKLANMEAPGGAGMATSLAAKLMDHPVDSMIDRVFLLEKYSKEDFDKFLDYLRKDNVQIFISSKNEQTDKTEAPFGIEYRSAELDIDLDSKTLAEIKKNFEFPKANPFIARSFDLVSSKKEQNQPEMITEEGFKIHLQTDTELGIPKTYLNISVQSETPNTLETYLLSSLYAQCKEEELREWGYPAINAGYSYSLHGNYGDKITLSVSGFSEKIGTLINTILNDKATGRKISECHIEENTLNQIKERVLRDIGNLKQMEAFRRLSLERQIVSIDKDFHWYQFKDKIPTVTLKQLNTFSKNFFKKVFIEIVASGNISRSEVTDLAKDIQSNLKAETLSLVEFKKRKRRFVLPPKNEEITYKLAENNNNNAMLTSYFLKDWNLDGQAHLMVLGQIISPAYFAELRSNQQLGYVVSSSPSFDQGYLGLTGVIQSQNHKASYLREQSDKFVDKFLKDFSEKITQKDIKPTITALVNKLERKATVLAQRHGKFRRQAIQYDGQYSIDKDLIKAVKGISASSMKTFISESFFSGKVGRLTYYYFGKNPHKETAPLKGKIITQPSETQNWERKDPYQSREKSKAPTT